METLLNDRYELLGRLGSGGMGEVWRARARRLDRVVAVKMLRHGPMSDDTSRARMRSEALLAASIHHPAVAQVYDYDEAGTSGDGDSYIVMQLVEGHTLAELLRENGAMAPQQVMSIVVQAAAGLQAAHEAGVVHRDVKPANIMLTPAGTVVLVDFGLARTESSEPLTDTGTVLGTAQYSSPEQSAGRPATPQSDLYSLGVVAHHCLTGTSPFRRDTPVATALAHLNEDPPPLGAEVPDGVRALVESLTRKEPSARPESAAAVAAAAAATGADATIDLPPTLQTPAITGPPPAADSVATSSTAATAVTPAPAAEPPAGGAGTRRRGVAIAALVAAVLVAAGFTLWPSSGSTTVPDVVGMNVDDATTALQQAGLTVRTDSVDTPDAQAGDVVTQDPPAESVDPTDGVVDLQVASGEVTVSAADLIGLPYADAATALEELGLTVERTDETSTADAGDVVALDRSGRMVLGTTVTLSVAVPPPVVADTGGSDAPVARTPTPDEGKGKADKPAKDAGKKPKGKSKGKG